MSPLSIKTKLRLRLRLYDADLNDAELKIAKSKRKKKGKNVVPNGGWPNPNYEKRFSYSLIPAKHPSIERGEDSYEVESEDLEDSDDFEDETQQMPDWGQKLFQSVKTIIVEFRGSRRSNHYPIERGNRRNIKLALDDLMDKDTHDKLLFTWAHTEVFPTTFNGQELDDELVAIKANRSHIRGWLIALKMVAVGWKNRRSLALRQRGSRMINGKENHVVGKVKCDMEGQQSKQTF
ncbi:hypothetical protein Q3G72_018286 [Acer saccharum]|nr:hypothetical protein Q3G72_018286 [Acer saccharum]